METFATRFSAQRAARRFLKNQAAKEGREFETTKSVTADGEQWTYKTLYVAPGDDGDEKIEVDEAEVPALVKDAMAKAAATNAEADAQKPRRKPVQARKPSEATDPAPKAERAPTSLPAERKARQPREKGTPSKKDIIVGLLTRKEGATTAEILAATGWPAVSVPQQAKAGNLTLRQEKDERVTRYWGTPA